MAGEQSAEADFVLFQPRVSNPGKPADERMFATCFGGGVQSAKADFV